MRERVHMRVSLCVCVRVSVSVCQPTITKNYILQLQSHLTTYQAHRFWQIWFQNLSPLAILGTMYNATYRQSDTIENWKVVYEQNKYALTPPNSYSVITHLFHGKLPTFSDH